MYQVLSSFSSNGVGIYLRDGLFESDIGIVNSHPSKETQWVVFISEFFFHTVVLHLKNYLNFLKNGMDIVHILNTKPKV